MKRFIIAFLVALLIAQVTSAYVGGNIGSSLATYENGPTLTENLLIGGADEELAYEYGYNRGYYDKKLSIGKRPLTAYEYYGRPHLRTPYTKLETQLAYYHRGEYRVGYNDGYSDASLNKEQLYSVDQEEEVTVKKTSTVISQYYTDIDALDLSRGVATVGYEQGYTDATNGKGKTPLKLFTSVSKVTTAQGNRALMTLQVNRGTYISNYKKGYEAVVGSAVDIPETLVIKSVDPTQLDYYARQELAYQLGYDYGLVHVQVGKSRDPMGMFRFGPSSVPASSSHSGYFAYSENPIYDVALAHAEKAKFISGYRLGYEAGR